MEPIVGVYFSFRSSSVLTLEVVAGQVSEPLGLLSRLKKRQEQRGDRGGGMES